MEKVRGRQILSQIWTVE